MNPTPQELAASVGKLVSFPKIALRVDSALADDTSSAEDIGAIIETDPALTAALLRIANSAVYGSMTNVDNITTAIRIVGSKEIRDLTFAICATDTFAGMSNELVSVEDFWTHSVYCAVAAQRVAESANVCRGISLFTAGLLHDIGHLVMFNQCPELSEKALMLSINQSDGRENWTAEREVFGFDHMAVGNELGKMWNFPDTLRAAIAYHHSPRDCTSNEEVAQAVHVGNSIAILMELESNSLADASLIDHAVLTALSLNTNDIPDIVESSSEAAEALLRHFV